MAKPGNSEDFPEKQTWGTWEELLLACAVHRYGTDSWDSVAAELQKRIPSLCSLTATACRQKYLDLKRRFSRISAAGNTSDEISAVPWLDELRKLRVAELRREVERYDMSILSLQSKVKRLEEERGRSFKGTETGTEDLDLDKIAEKKDESNINPGESVASPPNRLVNKSISSDPKDDMAKTGSEDTNRDDRSTEPVSGEPNRSGSDTKPGGENSCRGSCESGAKGSVGKSGRNDPGREEGNSPELIESVAESKGGVNRGEEEAKETSDVQSSASLPRKDEPDNEDQSPNIKGIPVESQPLADFLEILQSQPFGSHFSRRLEGQESLNYGKMIRQHIDFEIIRSRLEEGWYAVSTDKFFRDMLLLVSNARIFYGMGSSEFKAAEQIYELLKKQMSVKLYKQVSPPKAESSMADKAVWESIRPLSSKPRMSVPVIACRKRSALAARSSVAASGPVQKRTKTTLLVDEKPISDMEDEDEDEASDRDAEPLISNKRATRERAGNKVVNKNGKKGDQEKKGNTNVSTKKQSVVSFLKRMKGGTSSDSMKETVKTSSGADTCNGKKGAEQKKNKADPGKAHVAQKRATGKKQTNEKGSAAAKKSTGGGTRARPQKRSPLPAKPGKEASGKGEGGASSTRANKRSKR